jgi:hypothetical protein
VDNISKIVTCLVAAALFLAFLSACNNTARQQEIAITGVRGLQNAFNKGACQTFYQLTETRNNDLRQDWISGCQRIRKSLGTWQSLALVSARPLKDTKPQALFVEGIAGFVKDEHIESYRLETYWYVDGSEARLYYFYLEGGGKEIALPHLAKPSPKLDPDKGSVGAALQKTRPIPNALAGGLETRNAKLETGF